jgi:hypothetical protein
VILSLKMLRLKAGNILVRSLYNPMAELGIYNLSVKKLSPDRWWTPTLQRPIVAIGDASVFVGDWTQWIQFDPARFGITHISDKEAKPLYIQHHALNRFEERSYSPKGYVQIYLAKTFIYGTPEVIVYRGQVLIGCYCARHKVGYFPVSYHGDKWLISFSELIERLRK